MVPSTRPLRAAAALVTGLLTAAVAVYLGYHLVIGLQPDDTNHLETPLAMAVARQVEESPGVLYGPFSGHRPLVLIHAPLYYRLAGLGAWALAAVGFDPLMAAFAVAANICRLVRSTMANMRCRILRPSARPISAPSFTGRVVSSVTSK